MMKGVAAPPVTAINAAHATPPITVFAMFLGDENIFVKDFTTPLKMLFTDSPNESLPSSFPSSFDARSDDVIDLMPSCELVEFVEDGILEGEDLENYLKVKFEPYMNEDIAAVVL